MISAFFSLSSGIEDEDLFQARSIRAILLAMLAVGFVLPPFLEIVDRLTGNQVVSPTIFLVGTILGIIALTVFIILKAGYVRTASITLLLLLFFFVTYEIVAGQGIKDTRMAVYAMIVVLAGVFLGTRFALAIAGLATAVLFSLYLAELNGLLRYPDERVVALEQWLAVPIVVFIISYVLRFYNEHIEGGSQAVREANEALQLLNTELEARVADRTRALQLTIDVGRQINSILDPARLMSEVVELIHEQFNYYHVHVYLADAAAQTLTIAGGSGDVGTVMLAQGHRLRFDQGIVGRTARRKKAVLISDVTQSEVWLPNPLLPETKSEAAVPILLGDELLGVLDVQNQTKNSLLESDVVILQAVANQLAVALRNANVMAKTQRQAEQEALLNQINQKIQQANDVESLLHLVAAELDDMLDVRTDIRLGQLSHEN